MREYNFIKSILKKTGPTRNRGIIKGIGDDCAIIEYTPKKVLVLTSDSLVENVHFSRKYFSPWEIGARAMAVNISDICAMAGIPKYALVNIGFNKKEKQSYIDAVYDGLIHYAKNYGIDIIGGDTVAARDVFLSVTLAGEAEKNRVLRRNGAKNGDILFTTGLLGDSYAGLKVLTSRGAKRLKPYEYLPVKKHIVPLPRYMEGRLLAESGCVTSCIDISDGLVNDSLNIARESKKGILINMGCVPVSHSASIIASEYGEKPLDYALYGGEDFELLFTVAAGKKKKFLKFMAAAGVSVFEIGYVTAGSGVKIERNGVIKKADLKKVWNHF
jgi:thiamine-monophosphate kinase